MKRYLRKSLSSNEIEYLKIPKSEIEDAKLFQWIHSMEFRYRGGMYDLVPGRETIETDEHFTFTVVNDIMEEKLLAEFISSFDVNPFSGLMKTIKQFTFDAVKYFIVLDKYIPIYNIINVEFTFDIIQNYLSVETPPPKSFLK